MTNFELTSLPCYVKMSFKNVNGRQRAIVKFKDKILNKLVEFKPETKEEEINLVRATQQIVNQVSALNSDCFYSPDNQLAGVFIQGYIISEDKAATTMAVNGLKFCIVEEV